MVSVYDRGLKWVLAHQRTTLMATIATLVKHAGEAVSADELLEQAWNDPLREGPERVKFTIMRLVSKLAHGQDRTLIEALPGIGYRYVAS